MKKLTCKLLGHRWDRTHGFHSKPIDGVSACSRCHSIYTK